MRIPRARREMERWEEREGRENFIKMQISPSFVPPFLPSFLPQRCTTSAVAALARPLAAASPEYPQFRADSAPRRRERVLQDESGERGEWLRRDGKRRLTGSRRRAMIRMGCPCPQSICLPLHRLPSSTLSWHEFSICRP